MQNKLDQTYKTPRLWVALLPILFLIVMLAGNIFLFGSSALSGATQLTLLLTTVLTYGISKWESKTTWEETEQLIVKHIGESTPAILILFMIGALAGSWMLSGVVPTMIYYGLQIINPTTFLLTTCIISSIVSVASGSSWSTVATVGVAMLGIGKVLGFTEGWIAGAIISGAYFGDKISPLSETTNLAANVTHTPLFKHIRFMMITTVPNYILTLTIFTIAGFMIETDGTAHLGDISNALTSNYVISPWLLLIPVITFVLIAKKLPTLIILLISSLVAILVALIVQQGMIDTLITGDHAIWADRFLVGFKALYGSTAPETGDAMLNTLVSTRGMEGMLYTVWLILAAMAFGGAMEAGGMIQTISRRISKHMHNTATTVGYTSLSCLFLNITAADQYIAILLPGKMYSYLYKKKGYDSALLSRTLEDSATVTSVLVPWNSCGMAQSTVLNVSTLTYLPYCFFNLLSPLFTIAVAAIGYKIIQKKKTDL